MSNDESWICVVPISEMQLTVAEYLTFLSENSLVKRQYPILPKDNRFGRLSMSSDDQLEFGPVKFIDMNSNNSSRYLVTRAVHYSLANGGSVKYDWLAVYGFRRTREYGSRAHSYVFATPLFLGELYCMSQPTLFRINRLMAQEKCREASFLLLDPDRENGYFWLTPTGDDY